MKSDIDHLMEEARLDALFVTGSALNNPAMTYFTGLVHMTDGDLLKKRGEEAVLCHYPMEREEAARSGLRTHDLGQYDINALLAQTSGDRIQAIALRYQQVFEELKIRGRVGVYGRVELGPALSIFRRLEQLVPDVELVGEAESKSAITRARATKDVGEVERIRKMGVITLAVASDVAGFLTSHRAKGGVLVDRQGEALTIGEVKRRINLWLAMRGAENPEGTIFAIGHDAGVPHSAGQNDMPVEVGKPIVFDLFPREAGGGYFYDFTRTWCLGHASDELLKAHADVQEVYDAVYATLEPGVHCRQFQRTTCELFEARGHPTILSNPNTSDGYVHSLGHGVGLAIHEGPQFRDYPDNHDLLLPGSVFSFEPGLYYPQREIGVRIEDTLWVGPDGRIEILAGFPMDLLLKVPGA